MCAGLVLVSVGCSLFFLPHFTTPEYRPEGGALEDNLCRDRLNDTSVCDDTTSTVSYSNYLPLFVFARLLHGIGATPIYLLGVTFMDDCVTKERFSLYVGESAEATPICIPGVYDSYTHTHTHCPCDTGVLVHLSP